MIAKENICVISIHVFKNKIPKNFAKSGCKQQIQNTRVNNSQDSLFGSFVFIFANLLDVTLRDITCTKKLNRMFLEC